MLASIPSTLLTEWMAYFSLDPFGEKRADLRMAILAAVITNKPVYGYKQPRAVAPSKFLPDFTRNIRVKPHWQRDLQTLKSFSMIHNARMELQNAS